MKLLHHKFKQTGAVLTVLAMLLGLFPMRTSAADSETAPTPTVVFTFTDSAVTPSDTTAGGYSISGTTLTITSPGTYGVTGTCSNGSIVVKASTTGVKLVMDSLTLACSDSAPLLCKKASGVTVWLAGDSTLTDNENPKDEDSEDEAVADAFEGAAVKVNKDGASLLIKGSGTLTVDGSSCKNGIKAGAQSAITVSGGTLNIKAANNGLAADGAVVVKGGKLDIDAQNDGIKSSPDDDDTDSAGTITIYDGNIKINAQSDGINATGAVTIYGGTFNITAQSDGIQTDSSLTISDGTFHITTLNGYNSSSFNSSMSCKGLKASADDDTAENTITITGGTFTLNTADDAIHSDDYVEITGGKFTIQTGDDGVHADTSLILGTENGTVARDPDITINNSYEGLEAGTVYLYSGRYYVRASDDGINAAGGSGSDPGRPGGGDHFNPGGGRPGGRLFGMNGGAELSGINGNARRFGTNGGAGLSGNRPTAPQLMDTNSYSLNIAGGSVYVNADGDGLDSNGNLTLTGGTIEVWGQYNADNEPLDYDGTLTVNGATVFAAGSAGMGVASPSSGSQSYVNIGGSSGGGFGGGWGGNSGSTSGSISISSGNLVTVTDADGSTVYHAQAPKSANYVFFSAPDSTSWTVTAGSETVSCAHENSWSHDWNSVVTTPATATQTGVRTYTCSVCGAAETETIPKLVTIPADDDSGNEENAGYTVTFSTDGHCTIDVYYTQDYTTADETNVTSTVSRNSDTGSPDSTGDGQINFKVIPAYGYTVSGVSATEGTYKNIKGPSDTGEENVYRITKIKADTTVTVSTVSDGGSESSDLAIESVSAGADGVSVILTSETDSQSTLLIAAYTESRQFLRAVAKSCNSVQTEYQIELDTSDAAYVKAILLTQNTIPSCEAKTASVQKNG